MARLSAYREVWAPRGKSLVISSTNRIKRTGPSIEPWGTPRLMRKERLREPPTWTLALWSERKGRTQRTNQRGSLSERSLWNRAECQTESKPLEKSTNAKIVRSGGFFFWKPSQIDWDRIRKRETTCLGKSRPGKWRADDSIRGEKLGEKQSSTQKAWRCKKREKCGGRRT